MPHHHIARPMVRAHRPVRSLSAWCRAGLAGLGAVLLLAPFRPAHALGAEHPPLSPTRDAVVTYRFQTEVLPGTGKGTAPEHQVSVSFAGSGDRLRIDPDDGRSATILDRPAQVMTLISMQERRYVQFRPVHGLHNPFFLGLGMTYHKGDMTQVANTPCRNWTIESPRGKAQACVTDDGLILAEDGVDSDGLTGHMQAVSVRYGDIPADRFAPPADFQKFNPFAKGHRRQLQPVPGAAVDGAGHPARPDGSNAAGDQPRTPDDSVGDGSVVHGDQPGTGGQ